MRSRRSTSSRARRTGPGLKSRRASSPLNPACNLASRSPVYTDRLGRAIGRALQGGETLALYGPLGAGKTALVRGIAAGLGAPPKAVSSPTFVFIHEYHGRLPLAHVDLYRVNSTREAESTGLEEYFSGSTVVAIEWADKGLSILPPDRLEIELRHHTVGSRTIRLSATGPVSAALLAQTKRYLGRTARLPISKRLTPPNRKGKTSS